MECIWILLYCPSFSHETTAVKGRDIGELIILYYRDRKYEVSYLAGNPVNKKDKSMLILFFTQIQCFSSAEEQKVNFNLASFNMKVC